jgi:hypothetical protein
MQKQAERTRRGKKPRPQVDLRELLAHMVVDLQEALTVDTSVTLQTLLWLNPAGFREVVDDLTRKAESSIAEGGFDRYVALRQINALLEKNVDWYAKTAGERKKAAIRGFHQSEVSCRIANKRIAYYRKRTFRLSPMLNSVMSDARLICQEILGRVDEATWGEILDGADFGPGATESHKVETGTLVEKLASTYHHTATREALPMFMAYGVRNPHWVSYLCVFDGSYEVVEGDRVTTVLKKWDKDRTIGIQPSINVFLQKGLGTAMAKRLRRAGVNLRDQRLNQSRARSGSLDGMIATEDLKGASDHICFQAVDWFLPSDWLHICNALRCAKYRIGRKGEWREYEKYSAMGNGFTFPLESLIFYCVAKAAVRYVGCSPQGLGVFGDDLTIPVEAALVTIEALRFLGFRTNVDKTHVVGSFRESCGGDYVHGVDVRPVYLDNRPVGNAEIFDLHNRLLVGCVWPPTATCTYLRGLLGHEGPGIPGDFGLQLLDKSGWFPGKSVRISQGFITDPPAPAGWCTSYQASYWTFRERVIRHPILDDLKKPDWWATYLAFLKGGRSEERDAKTTISYTREGFSFTWLSVADIRGEMISRRFEDPLRA